MKVRDRIKEFRRVPAADLKANPRNWRKHPAAQSQALQGILNEVGYADALLARDTPDGLVLIDGHLRAETTPDAVVPVLVLDVDEDEANKLLAVLDPLAAMAKTDVARFNELRQQIDVGNDALQQMLDGLGGPLQATSEEDDVPKPPAIPTTKPGDLWLLGEHRLLCGDSSDSDSVAKLLDGKEPFIMVTDPPYGVQYDPMWRSDLRGKLNSRSGKIANDKRTDWTDTCKLFPGQVAYVWHNACHAEVGLNLEQAGFEMRSQIIWRKPFHIISRCHYHWQHEACWYAVRKGGSAKWCGGRKQNTIWDIMFLDNRTDEGENAWTNHSTQKPVECMIRPIRNHGSKGDDVYDPFVGSGSTIIAAEQLGRRCFAVEIEPAYCDAAIARWEKFTGGKAKKSRTR